MPKKLSINTKILICLATIFVIATSVLLANLLTMAVYPTSQMGETIKSNAFEIHFLSVGKSQNALSAQSLASDYQQIGAGGFIWQKDEYYHLISSAYQNKNDAILVQNNLKNEKIDNEIFSLAFKSFSITGNFNSEEKKVLQKVLNTPFSAYQNLYDTSVSLDTGVYNETSARLAVNAVHSSISSTLADFKTLFLSTENKTLGQLESLITSIQNYSASLCSDKKISKNQTYSSLIKYYYTQILHEFYVLTK